MPPKTSEYRLWSQTDWKGWLDEELNKRKKVFSDDPDELTSSYERETSQMLGYAGRELLELIQNADDAGEGFSAPNLMQIRLTKTALFVANTGVPFSPKGVKSLMVTNNSPKQFQRGRFIGYKGLGFRSVLGWSNTIVIVSGNLSVGFSREHAKNWLESLASESQTVREKLVEVRAHGSSYPIATLSVPFYFDWNAGDSLLDDEARTALRELIEQGFETVICLAIHDNKVHKNLESKIKRVTPEVLLFLKHLSKLEIKTPVRDDSWEATRTRGAVVLRPSASETQTWRIFTESGAIPRKIRPAEHPTATRYEIRLAIGSESKEHRGLHVYFPTQVAFPFPMIAHVTMEVTENRQHLLDGAINEWLAGKLAKFMAKTAESIVDQTNPWSAMLAVTPVGDLDPTLAKLGFHERLLAELRERKVIPVRALTFEKPSSSKKIKGDFDALLNESIFANLALFTEDENIEKTLAELGVKNIEYPELKSGLEKVSRSKISVARRADIIHRLVREGMIPYGNAPEFLIDEAGETITSESKPLLPPEKSGFTLPPWVPQRLLNSELVNELTKRFELTRVGDLAIKLGAFGVQRYSMQNVLQSVVAEGNRRVKVKPADELTIRREVVRTLWDLYSARETEEPKVPESVDVFLATRSGNFERASLLYLGRDYPDGKLLESLYGKIGGPFVLGPKGLGIAAPAGDVSAFLQWLGVASLPREIQQDTRNAEYLEFILDGLKYPARFGDDCIASDQAFIRYHSPEVKESTTIDRLEDVLREADPHAIICWIIRYQKRLDEWRTGGDPAARLQISPPYKQLRRQLADQSVGCRVTLLLRDSEWVPVTNGSKQKPIRCTLARGSSKEVAELIGLPNFNLEHPLFKDESVDRARLQNALTSVGVVTDLGYLSWDSFYEVLSELPEKDLDGKLAGSVYRLLLAGRSDPNPSGRAYDRFMEDGRMWGIRAGGGGYLPIKDLRYLDDQTIPESASKLFPLLDLDRRKGAAKVKRLFGVQPLAASDIKITIKEHEPHPDASILSEEVEELKPLVYALRVDEDSDRSELGPVRKLQVMLCKTAKGSIETDGQSRDVELHNGDSLIADSVAYLVAEPDDSFDSPLSDDFVADALGEIFSVVAKVDIRDQVARLATCSPGRRAGLLNKLTGGGGETRLGRVQEYFQVSQTETAYPEIPYIPTPPPPVLVQPTMPAAMEFTPAQPLDYKIGPVGVSQGEAIQPKSTRQVSRRVKANIQMGPFSGPHKQADPERSENLAFEFEKSKGRVPIKVSHIQGTNSFGCDIVSLAAGHNAEEFTKHPNPKSVLRFIEVKGRSAKEGSIHLEGNELNCARRFGERYFLYRVFEEEQPGTFQLVELSDPLHTEKDAIKQLVDVNPFKSGKSIRYKVTELEDDAGMEPQNAESLPNNNAPAFS